MSGRIVVFLAVVVCQALASRIEVAAPIVTARSSQYFAQNYNALTAPLVAPAVEAIAPVAYTAVAPSAASVSQFTRYAQYVAPAVASYVAPAAPVVAPATARFVAPTSALIAQRASVVAPAAHFVTPTATLVAHETPLIAQTTPVVAQTAPLVTSASLVRTTPFVAKSVVGRTSLAQPLASVAPVPALPQQPSFQTPNPDSEAVEVESARLSALPQPRSRSAHQQAAPEAPRFQHFPSFVPARFQDQNNQNQRAASQQNFPLQQQQQVRFNTQTLARNQAPEQQQFASPGLLSSQPRVPAPYVG